MQSYPVETIQSAVLAWYAANGRHDLPWRNLASSDIAIPYGVMISEFMLQQTQVERVVPKYRAFIRYFPTVERLAAATPSLVVTLWSGLGYNRRAILLHRAAQAIVQHYHGQVPNDPELLEALPGIGPYTAAAIVVFAYNEPQVVVDTNIVRFYELLIFGYNQPSAQSLAAVAHDFIPVGDSCLWHSALMDLMTEVRRAKTPLAQQQKLIELLAIAPNWRLPVLGAAPLKRPKQSPFLHSPRFYRGKIVAHLSQDKQHQASMRVLRGLVRRHNMPVHYSLPNLVRELKRDGLVTYDEPLGESTRVRLPSR